METGYYEEPIEDEALLEPIPGEEIEEQPEQSWVQFAATYEGNLADELDDQQLAKIGEQVKRGYDIDDGSRAEWIRGYDRAMDAAQGKRGDRVLPFPNASDVRYPLLMTAALQFAARAYPAIVQPGDLVKVKIEGEVPKKPGQDEQQAGPMEASTPQEVEQLQKLTAQAAKPKRAKRVSQHMSYQLREEMPEWEEETDRLLHMLPLVGCAFKKVYYDPIEGRNVSELVSGKDFVVNQRVKSLDACPRGTHVYPIYPHELQERMRAGIFRDVSAKLQVPTSGENDATTPYTLLEQYCRLDLDEDGYEEPYIVTLDRTTGEVLRIEADYDETSVIVSNEGEVISITPEIMWVKYSFLPDPEGNFYDIGFGHLLGDISAVIDTLLNQIIDAATLAASTGGFIAKGLRFGRGDARGEMPVAMNKWTFVEAKGMDIRNAMVPFQHPGPSAVLFQVLGLVVEAGREIASIKDVLTGDAGGKSNMPVGTTLALIEQGLQVFTSIYKRIYRSLKQEFRLLYRLNCRFLDEQAYLNVVDDPEASVQFDYVIDDCDLSPVADPNSVVDMQRMGKAQFLQQYFADPGFNQMELRKRVLDLARIEDPEGLLAPPDPNAAMMQKIQTAMLEAQLKGANADTVKTIAETILALAKAEAAEAGSQLDEMTQRAAILSGERGDARADAQAIQGARDKGMDREERAQERKAKQPVGAQ